MHFKCRLPVLEVVCRFLVCAMTNGQGMYSLMGERKLRYLAFISGLQVPPALQPAGQTGQLTWDKEAFHTEGEVQS